LNRAEILRAKLGQGKAILAPGAYNALTARLIEQLGFDVVYATAAGISNSMLGLPDVGLMCMAETLSQVNYIVNATSLPVIADIDTGYGNAVSVYRTVKEFEKAGVAALQMEDQVAPKKCGHFEGKAVIPADEMVTKIKAFCDARVDDNLMLIARTDARAVEGISAAIERAAQYIEAGADVTFVEAPRTVDELRMVGAALSGKAPQVANMMEAGGKTPLVHKDELEAMGFSIIIYANSALRASLYQMTHVLEHLRDDGWTQNVVDALVTKTQRDSITGLPQIEELEKRYAVGAGKE
jgi:2,3-dimethylmalate lyase